MIDPDCDSMHLSCEGYVALEFCWCHSFRDFVFGPWMYIAYQMLNMLHRRDDDTGRGEITNLWHVGIMSYRDSHDGETREMYITRELFCSGRKDSIVIGMLIYRRGIMAALSFGNWVAKVMTATAPRCLSRGRHWRPSDFRWRLHDWTPQEENIHVHSVIENLLAGLELGRLTPNTWKDPPSSEILHRLVDAFQVSTKRISHVGTTYAVLTCMYLLIESCNMIVKDWIYVDRPTLDTTIDSINEVVYLVSYLTASFSMSFCPLR